MKNKITFFAVLLVMTSMLSSCAFHYGYMNNSASLGANNFKYVKIVQGEATATYIFGFGGLEKQGLVLEAKRDLLQNYPLKDGQALANVTVDFKSTFILFVRTTKATITADIVEFK